MITKDSRIVVTGGAGFLGRQVVKQLTNKGYTNIFIPRFRNHDLRNVPSCRKVTKDSDVVIHLAANVGGIGYNRNFPAALYYDNLLMGVNMLHESYLNGVKKFVMIGTVCAYPKYTPVPFREASIWDGYPEETNAPYGLAKKILLVGSQAYRKQYNFNSVFLIPVNLYGPYDTFDPLKSHVIPALIRNIYLAKLHKQESVIVWGSGKASREFLYVDDCARAIILAMERYNKPEPVNIGYGQEITISKLVEKIINIIGFKGNVIWDRTKPDGQPRRLLDVSRADEEFGFKAETTFDSGLKKTINWYSQTYGR